MHAYADDHQVYSAFSPNNVNADIESMEKCITEIRSWMQGMHLKMNDSKAGYILFGTPQQLAKCNKKSIKVECPTLWSTQRQIRPFFHMY